MSLSLDVCYAMFRHADAEKERLEEEEKRREEYFALLDREVFYKCGQDGRDLDEFVDDLIEVVDTFPNSISDEDFYYFATYVLDYSAMYIDNETDVCTNKEIANYNDEIVLHSGFKRFTDVDEELEMLKKPIDVYGRQWMDWVRKTYTYCDYFYAWKRRWLIIPRVVDMLYWEEEEKLRKEYRKAYPPTSGEDFFESVRYKKTMDLYVTHDVEQDVIFKLYDPQRWTSKDYKDINFTERWNNYILNNYGEAALVGDYTEWGGLDHRKQLDEYWRRARQ